MQEHLCFGAVLFSPPDGMELAEDTLSPSKPCPNVLLATKDKATKVVFHKLEWCSIHTNGCCGCGVYVNHLSFRRVDVKLELFGMFV